MLPTPRRFAVVQEMLALARARKLVGAEAGRVAVRAHGTAPLRRCPACKKSCRQLMAAGSARDGADWAPYACLRRRALAFNFVLPDHRLCEGGVACKL